jgi:hypothetical protein
LSFSCDRVLNNAKRIKLAEDLIAAADFPFPCGNGCGFSGVRAELAEHAAACSARSVPCPDSACGEEVAAEKVEAHLREAHDDVLCVTADDPAVFWLTEDLADDDAWSLQVQDLDGYKFVEKLRKVDSVYYAWVTVLGDQSVADDYEVEISVKGNGSTVTSLCDVYPVDMTEYAIREELKCFSLGERNVRRCMVGRDVKEVKETYTRCLKIYYKLIKLSQ